MFEFEVSYTTRQRRDNETDGVDYNYVSVEEFKEMESRDEFLNTL